MAFHSDDGSEFIGLREKNGFRQVVYDHRGGHRVVLRLDGGDNNADTIRDILKVAASKKNALRFAMSTLLEKKISFHVMSEKD